MRTTQYSLILVTQILLVCAVLTFGAKIVDLSLARARALNTCAIDRTLAAQQQGGIGQQLSC